MILYYIANKSSLAMNLSVWATPLHTHAMIH